MSRFSFQPRLAALAWLALLLLPGLGWAVDSPTSYGEAARVDSNVLRLPMMRQAPTIDGAMAPSEWEDSAALSGFWYDYATADFRFLAPLQTQLQFYAGYDKDHLYFCFTSPIYPEKSWLKARGRYPDVLEHPLYGALWDDHHELELRPYADVAKGFQHGLLRFDVNAIGNIVDWYWSQQAGHNWKWQSGALIRTQHDDKRWVVEYAVPLKSLIFGNYTEPEEDGTPKVKLPPADGTVYRTWLTRGIGGNGKFFNVFDNHMWNTCKTALIFDSTAPSFQINELGPIMEDRVDLRLSVKNHNTRSETVRLGFFVESNEGLIYSSYSSPELKDGLLELRPGERRELRLQQPFPGISTDGNVLWFDVRAAGQPAKTLFRTRLIRFHGMDGGVVNDESFRARRVEIISTLRPPRKPFDFRHQFSAYTRRVAGVVDRGIAGASEEARRAKTARLSLLKDNDDEDLVAEQSTTFQGNFATFMLDPQDLVLGESYKVAVLLFDEYQRIVGEEISKPFTYERPVWMGNDLGKADRIWEPFTPIQVTATGLETLKHRFTVADSGLPAQLEIKADPRELPLELRPPGGPPSVAALIELGRGPQWRAPMRLQAVIGGQTVSATIRQPAKVLRQGQSELEYQAELLLGKLPVTLTTRYDCDGSLHATLVYGGPEPVAIERLELITEIAGQVDLVASETGGGGMTGADRWECTLPAKPGLVWDSSVARLDLFYNKFVPWFWFGSADRAWSWYCDSDQGWVLDREGSSMDLERNAQGEITWRVKFVNHPTELRGARTISFSLLTHPAKPKPKNHRAAAWHYLLGHGWATGYQGEGFDLTEDYLKQQWRIAASAPKDTPDSERTTFRKDEPPFHRYGWWRNEQMKTLEMDQEWEDKATYYFERFVRVGRRVGWWMDEYFPVVFGRSENLAAGNAYFRDLSQVAGDELPWHPRFLTGYMRNHYKRLSRIFAENNVPQRQHTWSNNASNMLEAFLWNSVLVEECGGGTRAYEVDMITQFPNSLYRVMGKNYTGLVTSLMADFSVATSGDDPRVDRQRTGLALLHDFGVTPNGPHGTHFHKQQAINLLKQLAAFGFFEYEGIEKLPFWRNEAILGLGEQPSASSKVFVTAYRRALPNGRGYQAIFVILNESDKPVSQPLILRQPARVLGGPNTLRAASILATAKVPDFLAEHWQAQVAALGEQTALRDLETGEVIPRLPGASESYGPVHVPWHDYRLLYGEFQAP